MQHELLSGTPFVTKAQGIFYSPPIPSLEATTVLLRQGAVGFRDDQISTNVSAQ